MFPLTHIWFSEKILGYINNISILGAVFPDIVITKCLDYKATHHVGLEIYTFFKKAYPGLADFARSMITHTVNPCGLDYYSDEAYLDGYKGYCFQKGIIIESNVIKACNIPREYGLWKAHNFIEMGIELNIAANEPELSRLLHNSFCDKKLIKQLSEPIGEYYRVSKSMLMDSFEGFSDFIELEDICSDTLAAKYYIQMKQKHNIEIDIEQCANIIETSRQIISKDFDTFINYCIKEVKQLI